MDTPTDLHSVSTPRCVPEPTPDDLLTDTERDGSPRAAAGDRAQLWEDLVREHWAFVYALSYRLTRHHEDAEDLTQEAFLRAWRRLDPNVVVVLRGWLYRVTMNLYVDDFRRARRLRVRPTSDEALERRLPALSAVDVVVDDQVLDPRLERALNDLPPHHRAVVLLSVLGGYSYDEIATMLHLQRGTVASCMHRGRAQLLRQLDPGVCA